MRVNEFLQFMGRLRGLDGENLRTLVALARERVFLDDMGDVIIGRLSRGYRQRVSLAQAVLHQPDLLVLDEPTNGLDPRQVIEFRDLIRRLAEQCAIVVTSHILGEIERIADQVAILLAGRLLAVKRLDGLRTFRVRTNAETAPRVAPVLKSTPGVAEVLEEPGSGGMIAWRVRMAASASPDALSSRLCAGELEVVEIAEIGSDLERTFLSLTSGAA
jgi:ABC-2 type transport system ATP-binding protein